ncbi:peptide-methionine (S)-S-oxide reductase [Jeotgalibaca caeni]|uniref:peptide-methionine (S)-S-oxide reductase n=1 Tax=Jeotgalibaca caeni TaxID=3028623 RepID=UPI00237D9CBB|nr:peptide-methionine (S)-S-oxide reductase [Jeotgalibaca caeni]MDE1548883.1 peptide-methionine (S)-S-oxide reductase [Jeotgalibaca caeni]
MNVNQYQMQATKTEKIIFGMGCFWSPDSLFGAQPGVIQTLTGFAGGTTSSPTYRSIGDHTETIEVIFDPTILSCADLLRLFWQSHDATKDRSYKERQYISLLVLQNEEQKQIAEQVRTEEETRQGRPIDTEVQLLTPFYPAEPHHQKYYLRRFKNATARIQSLFPTEEAFIQATISARLNGFVREKTKLPAIKEEIATWGLEEAAYQTLLDTLTQLKW